MAASGGGRVKRDATKFQLRVTVAAGDGAGVQAHESGGGGVEEQDECSGEADVGSSTAPMETPDQFYGYDGYSDSASAAAL